MKKITLILGGIRSGKSAFAEQKAEFYAEKPVYIATSMPANCDMKTQAARLQMRRGNRYELIEAPYDLTGPLRRLKDRTVLVDCLTFNLSNRLMATGEYMDREELAESDEDYLKDVYKIIRKNKLNVIFVSNDAGAAPAEIDSLGRHFQELHGRWNRIMAGYADEVYTVRAGIPTLVKKEKIFPFKISAPSYLLPSGCIENVTYLMDKAEDIQLVVLDPLREDVLLKKETLTTLEYLAGGAGITYSVLMPARPNLSKAFQQRLDNASVIIEALSRLNISTFTFRYDLPEGVPWENLAREEIQSIESVYTRFFSALREQFPGVDLSLENTGTPLSALDRIISGCGISYCIDIGHLAVQGRDLAEVGPRLKQASVVHLYGWAESGGRKYDHRPIIYHRDIFKLLESFTGILTIENHHKILYEKSLDLLKTYF
jgi:adenosylcobinamide kinase/adenosylcobinamide-phosphate guanylyltransferase